MGLGLGEGAWTLDRAAGEPTGGGLLGDRLRLRVRVRLRVRLRVRDAIGWIVASVASPSPSPVGEREREREPGFGMVLAWMILDVTKAADREK